MDDRSANGGPRMSELVVPRVRWLLATVAFMNACMTPNGLMVAQLDPDLRARIVARRPLSYEEGADERLDRPAHVRAASGLAWIGDRLAAVQDDANFIALVTPQSGRATAVTLPPGPDGRRQFEERRGTKHLKLDLEACFAQSDAAGTRLFAFGSGSTAAREHIAVVTFDARQSSATDVRLVEARSFYAALRAAHTFSGSELNLEGVALRGDTLLLFQRGNGAPQGDRLPQNAVAALSWPAMLRYLEAQASASLTPALTAIKRYDLGETHGVPYTFTDAAVTPSGAVLFLASAEDSADSISDGGVFGTRVGLISEGKVTVAPLLDESGRETRLKAEGLIVDKHAPSRLYMVVDMDDPELASELLEVELTHPAHVHE